MRLGQRLRELDGGAAVDVPTDTDDPEPRASNRAIATLRQEPAPVVDPLAQLRERVQESLFARLGTRLYESSLTEERLQALVREELGQVVDDERIPLTGVERERLTADVCDDVLGYGPIQAFLDDSSVTEVMVNSDVAIYVERAGRIHRTTTRFLSQNHLRRVIERIVSQVGRRIDESSPMVDARLPDGSRVNAVVPPLAIDGPTLTIRKFAVDPFDVDDLVSLSTMTPEIATLLEACTRGRLNILVSGGTGTGKTTLLNVLSSFIPEDERIVTIEDAAELQLHQDHVIRLESRPPNIEGRGQIAIRELVRNSLRMRPDRIVVGETRGGEALDMLQAMNTGHDGSLSTVHANSPRDAISRLETMVLMAGMELPSQAIREQIAAAVDVIVQIARLRDGTRRITHVTEVHGMEGHVVTLQDVFVFDFERGMDADGRYLGGQRATGVRPRFVDQLEQRGIPVPPHVFSPPGQDPDIGPRGRTLR